MTPYLSRKLVQWIQKFIPGRVRETELKIVGHRLPVQSIVFSLPFRSLVSIILVFFIVFELFQAFSLYRSNNFKIQVDPKMFPIYAVQFMKANRLKGNILVPFDWGEYLIWHLPESRVSMDGRFRTVYPEKIIRENRYFNMGLPKGKTLVDQFSTDIILSRKPVHTQGLLNMEENWEKIYEDWNSKLFVRKHLPGQPGKPKDRDFIHPQTRPSYEFP